MASLMHLLSATIVIELLTSHSNVHKCMHDKIGYKIHQQYVQYKNNPFDKHSANQRNLLQDESYQVIRITPYYDPQSINESILTNNQISYIKSLVSTSIHHLQSFIKVIPIEGPLFVDRCPQSSAQTAIHGEFVFPACSETKLAVLTPKSCGRAIIPEQHLAESWSSNVFGYSRIFAPGGTGVADTDLVIYVTYDNEYCSNQTLAYALPCSVDQIGRPIAGNINFCSSVLQDDNYWKFDVMVTLHELTHVLVFTPTLWDKFYDVNTRTIIPYEQVISYVGNTSYIISPKVKQIAYEHYDCDTLVGVPLENWGSEGTVNSHWEAKYMQYEYMNGMILSAQLYVSKFTLAFMDDSGWYKIDYNYAEEFTWGINEGCEFFTDDCIDVNNHTSVSNYPQYFCESNVDNGCSFDYTSIAYCLMYNYSMEGIPNKFKYYTDDVGGTEIHDYCGLRNPVDNQYRKNYTDFEPICWDVRGNYLESAPYSSSYFAIDSRCVETINIHGDKSGYCFKHQCVDYDSVHKMYNAVQIEINSSDIITCYRNQSLFEMPVSSYPSLLSILCPNIDAVCGSTSMPFACYWGYYNDDLGTCICSAGYSGDNCNIQHTNYSVPEVQIVDTRSPTRAIVDIFCLHWVAYSHPMFQGQYVYNGQYESYPSYIHYVDAITSTYLYFSHADSRWQLTKNKNTFEKSNYDFTGYCEQYGIEGKAMIETCNTWYFFDGIKFVKEKIIYDTTCKHLATLEPTINPTMPITLYPTIYPTLHPIESPTLGQIDIIASGVISETAAANNKNVFVAKFVFILFYFIQIFDVIG